MVGGGGERRRGFEKEGCGRGGGGGRGQGEEGSFSDVPPIMSRNKSNSLCVGTYSLRSCQKTFIPDIRESPPFPPPTYLSSPPPPPTSLLDIKELPHPVPPLLRPTQSPLFWGASFFLWGGFRNRIGDGGGGRGRGAGLGGGAGGGAVEGREEESEI